MPLNRYQLRSEYSLADPELYKVADKDDPEALLEGVAMAGLVGVLRQLGDLAEFAAEIFHDLHEEVMATAGRGHGLIVRVQQLEAEFPSIERTLLSQTSHTAFLYNTGVDWHPNLHMDQSVVTRKDLPRFVMDSYEECRGPPRLFLLDKYDVAGAGACLKRFTDPSFFKMESTSTGRKLEGQREKKTRRIKKRGPRWRNGDTPESFPSSHAKLHQLFLEERIESGINDPARRVKLKKRQFTGSRFEQDNVRSYMEKFLDTSPPEQKILHEICMDPLQLTWKSDKTCEAGLEVVDIGTISPVKESRQTDRTVCSSPDVREMVFDPSMDDLNQDKLNLSSENESVEVPGYSNENNDGNVSTIPKEMNVDAACEFDDVASEIDNYVDALANIEFEVETDSECKKNPRYLNWKPIVADSDGSERHRDFQSVSLDSQSVGYSATSEDGDIFSKGRESSSCSNSVNTLTETTPDLDAAVVDPPSFLSSNSDSNNMSFDHHSTSEEILRKERDKHAAASTHAEADDALKSEQEFNEALKTSSLADLNMKIFVDTEANPKENLSSDSVLKDSAKHYALLGETDEGHTFQNTIISSDTTLHDASEDSGHSFGVEPSIHDKEGQNTSVSPDMLHGLPNTTNASTCSSLAEGYDKDLGRPVIDSCSDGGPPSHHQPVCEPTYLEKTNSIYLPCEEHFSTSTTEENSKDVYHTSDYSGSFDTQELLPGTMNSGCTPFLDFGTENISWSQEDPSVENSIAMSEEKVSCAPHISQVGNPAISNQLQSCVPEISTSEFTEAPEMNGCGVLEAGVPVVASSKDGPFSEISEYADDAIVNDSFEVGKSSSTTDPLETQPEWLKLLSETIDTTVPEICQDEASKQYSEDDTCAAYPVSAGGNADEAVLDNRLSEGDLVSQDFTWIYLDQTEVLESGILVNKPVSEAATMQGEANIVHDPAGQDGDEDRMFYHDASSPDMPFKHAYYPDYVLVAENDSNLNHDAKSVKHAEIVTDGLGKVEVHDYPLENETTLSTSLSPHPEKSHELPLFGTEKFWQNDEELTKEHRGQLTESRRLDLVQDTFVTPPANMCNISPDDSSPLILLDETQPKDLKNSEQLSVEAPLASEKSSEHLESTSSNNINLLEANNLNLHDQNILKPEQNDMERSRIAAALHHDNQPTASETSPESAENSLETCSLVSPGNGMLSGTDQVTQVNSGQPHCQSGFSDLGKNPAEPQINLEPPSLPPLPPMQWRLGKFQNLPAASAGRQMVQPVSVPVQVPSMSLPTMHHNLAPVQPMNLSAVHHALASFQPVNLAAGNSTVTPIPLATQPSTLPAVPYAYAPLQPVTLPTIGYGTETIARTFSSEGQLGYSDGYHTQPGVFTLPVPIAISEGFYQINTGVVGRQDNLPPTVPSTSNNSDPYATQQNLFITPVATVVSDGASQLDTSGVGKQESQLVSSSPTSSVNDNQISEESNQPDVDGPESRSLVEDHSSEHRSISEAKVNAETGIQNELLGNDPKFPEEEGVNPYVQPLVSLAADYPGQVHMMSPEAGRTWSSAYDVFPSQADGISNGTLQKKPPRPRNPLIDEVVAIDKSKLRKVDRTKPSLKSKPDERELLLEQMQLRKVERVKPPVESKVEGGEYRLEHSQLRKVGERVKPSVEQKSEEEFSLEQLQLRKVGERVKPPVEPKSEEREFLPEQLQLRKVVVKNKQETELKVEENGSPLAQLRKVKEKVREEGELKSEETESPRVQLRKVKERVREEVELKGEETESPRLQLRKVGERVQPQVEQKVEERDSLFEQIRNKSFNLKPAVAARPNIQGPRTNLKVAAILEKASTIRQAMAGSDEDEEDADNWSDS